MNLKPLNSDNYTMRLIKDLGIKNNKRTALFECISCERSIVCRTDSLTAKRENGECLKCRKSRNANANGRIGKIWINMNQRCYNKKHPQFKDYGARGIIVCNEWRNNFDSFKKWALKNKYGNNLFIDRINNDEGYSPHNCRFADRCTQNQNRRIYKTSSSNYRGVSKYKNKWRARINVKNQRISLGLYAKKEDAAIAYNNYIIENKLNYILNIVV